MKGLHKVIVQNNRLHYELTTVVSGTGNFSRMGGADAFLDLN